MLSRRRTIPAAAAAAAAALIALNAGADTNDDARTIAAIDTQYQAAVESGDWQTMDRILHPDFVLVLGDGVTHPRQRLLDSARNRSVVFEKQVEVPGTQLVRMYGKDTATVTALLWLKGTRNDGRPAFEYKLWFTDTYVRTHDGWRYAFGQASLPLPQDQGA
jgi:ketosteroid isomerase-like protein